MFCRLLMIIAIAHFQPNEYAILTRYFTILIKFAHELDRELFTYASTHTIFFSPNFWKKLMKKNLVFFLKKY